ncbi:hypothetical protein EJD97_009979 [Solanum chilense]|uniref:Uncharacterized protein n=1 Tax=Solanum chilense TaxID=4083 RepID=A0A6N2BIU1_SOLCI|nr:hypothetical protein EJD97_009979 [Solanum chilense]
MAAEEVLLLKLFDTYWFEQEILFSNTHKFKKLFQENPHEIQESSNLLGRSQSDCSSKKSSDVCQIVQKQNIFEGSNTSPSFSQLGNSPTSVIITHNRVAQEVKVKARNGVKGIIRIRRSSSELELEELKGFMDLGFEFSEEDKNSSLVRIVPGLEKWGIVDENVKKKDIVHKRPYLSEAWEILEKRKMSKKLLKWRFPAMKNDMNMKHNLRFWAQTVASTFK